MTNSDASIVDWARSWLGRGELGRNNRGPDIAAMRYVAGLGGTWRAVGPLGAWCAVFCSAVLAQTAGGYKHLPFKTSAGAKALTRRVAKAPGGRWVGPADIQPGDLVCWHRGLNARDWRGHVGICIKREGSIVTTLEGNVGAYPALVRRYRYRITADTLVGPIGWRRQRKFWRAARMA